MRSCYDLNLLLTPIYLLPPTNKVCSKVMFLHASVILSTVGGVACMPPATHTPLPCMPPPATHATPPPWMPPSRTQPHQPPHQHTHALSPAMHAPPATHAPPPPSPCTDPSPATHVPPLLCTPPSPQYGQWAGGMHPTAMHPCYWEFHIEGAFTRSEIQPDFLLKLSAHYSV